jgi:hypothetical protein
MGEKAVGQKYPSINFSDLFMSPMTGQRLGKLQCILNYFHRISNQRTQPTCTHHRAPTVDHWLIGPQRERVDRSPLHPLLFVSSGGQRVLPQASAPRLPGLASQQSSATTTHRYRSPWPTVIALVRCVNPIPPPPNFRHVSSAIRRHDRGRHTGRRLGYGPLRFTLIRFTPLQPL